MIRQIDIEWPTCERASCIGIRIPSTVLCMAHADEEAITAALQLIGENGVIDLRGVTITQSLFERILTAVPRVEHGPLIKDGRFELATFSGSVQFTSVTFDGHARFDGATFNGDARFDVTTFVGDASFDGVTFTALARLDSAKFGDAGYFREVTFSGNVIFDSATFTRWAWFDKATFAGEAWFSGTRFSQEASFHEAAFNRVRRLQASTRGLPRFFAKRSHGEGRTHSRRDHRAAAHQTGLAGRCRLRPARPTDTLFH